MVNTKREMFKLTKDNINIVLDKLQRNMFYKSIEEDGVIGRPYYYKLNSYYGNNSPIVKCKYFNYLRSFPTKIYIGDYEDCILIDLSIDLPNGKKDMSTINIPIGSVVDIMEDHIVTYTEGVDGIKYVFAGSVYSTRFRIFTRLNDHVPADVFRSSKNKRDTDVKKKLSKQSPTKSVKRENPKIGNRGKREAYLARVKKS